MAVDAAGDAFWTTKAGGHREDKSHTNRTIYHLGYSFVDCLPIQRYLYISDHCLKLINETGFGVRQQSVPCTLLCTHRAFLPCYDDEPCCVSSRSRKPSPLSVHNTKCVSQLQTLPYTRPIWTREERQATYVMHSLDMKSRNLTLYLRNKSTSNSTSLADGSNTENQHDEQVCHGALGG